MKQRGNNFDMSRDIYAEFRKLSPKVTGGLVRMRAETFRDEAVLAKYKILCALAIVIVEKCEPCLKAYTKMAYKAGATREEFVEFLNVSITEGGCPGEEWALKAHQVWKELEEGQDIEEEICCDVEEAKQLAPV